MLQTPDLTLDTALELDKTDALAHFRAQFFLPVGPTGQPVIYLNGNSLGLQSVPAKAAQDAEMTRWAQHGVQGWHHAEAPWLPYHEQLAQPLARLVGALTQEVVAMGALTTNLHLLLVSFYRPQGRRTKVVMEADAFPSDLYAMKSQLRFHGLEEDELVLLRPRAGEATLRTGDILETIADLKDQLALVLLGGVNYLTGQFFDIPVIAQRVRAQGGYMGVDLAHAIGNVPLSLHDWGIDFAVWCSYKYLNGGPGAVGGLFVHERHLVRPDIPRLEGWWGHDKSSRFAMPPDFQPIPTAEAWQISTPSIFAMAPLVGSLSLFDEAGLVGLRTKSVALTNFLLQLLETFPTGAVEVLTPRAAQERGCQLSLRIPGKGKALHTALLAAGIVCDWREPDVIRIAPAPLYNSFEDVFRFAAILRGLLAA